MITVAYLPERNVLCVTGIPTPFPAGSLQVRRLGNQLAVASPHQDTLICGWTDAGLWTRSDGSGFGSVDEAYAYLTATCSREPGAAPVVSATAAPGANGLPKGSPVALSRTNGQIQGARADTYALAFIAGLAEADIAGGFPTSAIRTSVTRDDWTPVAGTAVLSVGQPYFLGLTGGITATPDMTPGNCLVRVGQASTPTQLVFIAADPIRL